MYVRLRSDGSQSETLFIYLKSNFIASCGAWGEAYFLSLSPSSEGSPSALSTKPSLLIPNPTRDDFSFFWDSNSVSPDCLDRNGEEIRLDADFCTLGFAAGDQEPDRKAQSRWFSLLNRLDMFYGALIWDPWLILAQIVCLQCMYYLTVGLFLTVLVATRVERMSLAYFFDFSTLTVSTVTGCLLIASFLLSSLAG
jgi:Integral membrane protein S linking to the trans Golgi network